MSRLPCGRCKIGTYSVTPVLNGIALYEGMRTMKDALHVTPRCKSEPSKICAGGVDWLAGATFPIDRAQCAEIERSCGPSSLADLIHDEPDAKMRFCPADEIRDFLSYDAATGVFRWRTSLANGVQDGQIAGNIDRTNGYVRIGLRGRQYGAHRLAWWFNTGEWPTQAIDHQNLDRADNRICNLRLATYSQNSANSSKRANCSSRFKGVTRNRRGGNWLAGIRVNGQHVYLGTFEHEAEAAAAYMSAAVEAFGEFARAK